MKCEKCVSCKDVKILRDYVEMIAKIRELDKQSTIIHFELDNPCLLVCEENRIFLIHSGCPEN